MTGVDKARNTIYILLNQSMKELIRMRIGIKVKKKSLKNTLSFIINSRFVLKIYIKEYLLFFMKRLLTSDVLQPGGSGTNCRTQAGVGGIYHILKNT